MWHVACCSSAVAVQIKKIREREREREKVRGNYLLLYTTKSNKLRLFCKTKLRLLLLFLFFIWSWICYPFPFPRSHALSGSPAATHEIWLNKICNEAWCVCLCACVSAIVCVCVQNAWTVKHRIILFWVSNISNRIYTVGLLWREESSERFYPAKWYRLIQIIQGKPFYSWF